MVERCLPPIWVVYDHPKDYPDHYIARRWDGIIGTDDILKDAKLEVIQQELELKGLVKLMPNEGDDPRILECWI